MENLFNIVITSEKKDDFTAAIKKRNNKGGTVIGGMGRDKKGLYVNINSSFTLNEVEELIKQIKEMNEDYGELKFIINCD